MKYDLARCERQLAIRGWKKIDLAEKTSLSVGVITKFFKGHSVRNDTARTIIKRLGLDPEEIVLNGKKPARQI